MEHLKKEGFLTGGILDNSHNDGHQYHITNISVGEYFELYEHEVLDASPRYQRPYTYLDTPSGEGDDWQRGLIADMLRGSFIQPIHLRFRHDKEVSVVTNISSIYFVNEIIDGGHRTRTIVGFIKGYIKTPLEFRIHIDGKSIDCSGRRFFELPQKVQDRFLKDLQLTLVFYFNLSEDAAGEKFRTLNDLHTMSNQGKRNSYYKHISRYVRELGASDLSQLKIFSELDSKGNPIYTNLNLNTDTRMSDEVVAELIYLFNKMKPGDVSNYSSPTKSILDNMYENDISESQDESLSHFNKESDTYKRVNRSLEFLDKFVTGNMDSDHFSKKRITKSSIMKMVMFFDWVLEKNPKVKIDNFDPKMFWKQMFDVVTDIPTHLGPHIEYQTYKIDNGNVIIDKKGDVKKHKSIGSAWSVFGTGKRIDDMQYILYPMMLNFDLVEWGFTKVVKDIKREFNQEQKEKMYRLQDGKCRITGKSLRDIKYAADHIIPHTYGAPTIIENGQLICSDINRDKSSGVTIEDVRLICERMGYDKTESLIDMFETKTQTLLPDDIRLVVKKLFPKQEN